jgi:predicted O-methyltransferase YrrM
VISIQSGPIGNDINFQGQPVLIKSFLNAISKARNYDEVVSERDKIRAKYDELKSQLDELYVPPGHFFSPIPSLDEIRKDESIIFGKAPETLSGIDLNVDKQLTLFKELARFYPEMPFKAEKSSDLRYHFVNDAYTYGDGIVLYGMIRHLEPKKIIEVGSGFSSCLILDTNDLFFNGQISTTFIEPYPQLLKSLLQEEDEGATNLISKRLQDVSLDVFESLGENDILFIDSTHVSKINSDVNYLIFEILPRLSKGVYIHIHDIFYPFEYPKWWVYEGRGWNEAYLLRAFLEHNRDFRIMLMNTYLRLFHKDVVQNNMPLCLERMGGSIWIRKEC